MFREKPDAEKNQDERYKQAHPDLKDPGGMQKEKHAQPDQDGGSGWNFRSLKFLARAKHQPQTKGIGRRLSHLNRLRASNGVDDLIHVKESKRDSKERMHVPRNIGAFADDQEHHDHEVRQSLRVLRAIDRSHPEWEETCENACHRWIRP